MALIEENKWRAVRDGVGGNLFDLDQESECPAKEVIGQLASWFFDDLGNRKEVEYAHKILDEGAGAGRQLATLERPGDLKAVVDQLVSETSEGIRP